TPPGRGRGACVVPQPCAAPGRTDFAALQRQPLGAGESISGYPPACRDKSSVDEAIASVQTGNRPLRLVPANAPTASKLRVLRLRSAARFQEGDDLHVRVHLLPGVCDGHSERGVPEL